MEITVNMIEQLNQFDLTFNTADLCQLYFGSSAPEEHQAEYIREKGRVIAHKGILGLWRVLDGRNRKRLVEIINSKQTASA